MSILKRDQYEALQIQIDKYNKLQKNSLDVTWWIDSISYMYRPFNDYD